MTNADRPITDVTAFVEHVKGLGIYNSSQATNYNVALKLALDHARKKELDVDSMTVGEVQKQAKVWLDEYGASSRAAANSIATYLGRINKVLGDFVQRCDGDYMQWKRDVAKQQAKAPRKPKTKEMDMTPPPAGDGAGEVGPGEQSHTMRLPESKTARLILPDPVTLKEIDAVWKLLGRYKEMLIEQVKIEGGIEDDDELPP